jgi:hypothetical protein
MNLPSNNLLAETSGLATYWKHFIEYWQRVLVTENGIVTSVLILGAVGIFIITRGKWKK